MNNKFINYNGATLLNTKNKKTQVEIQIEKLKQQEQAINKELWVWETKQKKTERLLNYLDEVERFSTKFLTLFLQFQPIISQFRFPKPNYKWDKIVPNWLSVINQYRFTEGWNF